MAELGTMLSRAGTDLLPGSVEALTGAASVLLKGGGVTGGYCTGGVLLGGCYWGGGVTRGRGDVTRVAPVLLGGGVTGGITGGGVLTTGAAF